VLARYSDHHGRLREVLTRPGRGGTVFVIDRDAGTRGDRRVVAHLAADEPLVNAALICRDYLSYSGNRRCRSLTPADLSPASVAEGHGQEPVGSSDCDELLDGHGRAYQLLPFRDGIAIPELRWHRLSSARHDPELLSLRKVIAALESYQPVREITACALSFHRNDRRMSVSTLRSELERMDASPIVLNRGLREAVQKTLAQGTSMNEITIRCGRFKRDSRGNTYGDTSWLARRVGLHANPGESQPTPWVHSDVLALIARSGLGISPREVELG
jgi:hypothetical protein